jgi:DNA polymerase-1
MLTPAAPKKLFLLDAYALIYRAYFAFAKNPRVNSKGENTSAAFGFTNVLIDVLKTEQPTHIAVVFDPPGGSTQRQEEFTAYKAHREEMPEDIRSMIHPIKQIVKAFNIPILEVAGYEADDVIGTVALMAEKTRCRARGIRPRSAYRSAPPVMVNVFPEPEEKERERKY